MEKRIKKIVNFYGQQTRWGVFDKKKISNTLVAGMGAGGDDTYGN